MTLTAEDQKTVREVRDDLTRKMLVALWMSDKPIYAGTANEKKAAKRHARNKVARKSRRHSQ